MARKREVVDEPLVVPAFQPGDLVTLRDHTVKAFDPKYKGEYRVIKYLGKTQVLLRNSKGEEAKHHVAYLKKTNPIQETVEKIPDFQKFGRAAKLQLNPDLKWEYKIAEIVQAAESDEKNEYPLTQEIVKALIFYLCFKFIRSTKGQKSLKNLIWCYNCVQCLHKACTSNASL